MKSPSNFTLSTAIPYVNAKPHIGHVLEWLQADCVARYQTQKGKQVSFISGSDENSLKNVQAAQKAGLPVQVWLDQYAQIFKESLQELNIGVTDFRRGSDQEKHWPGVQKLWQLCVEAGDIYQKSYEGLYCLGCEAFYTPEDLIDGNCPEHLKPPEKVSEKNYFFRLSKYQERIRNLILSDELKIISTQYKNEMLGFIDKGLEDFSVSRSVERGPGIGVPIPSDSTQVMYVWFDALAIYLTAIGWGYDQSCFEAAWPADVHLIGKGINRFHSIYWIGMLLSAKLALPKTIFVHGYITVNGQKMSKSLGNVIDPESLVTKYGLEPVRYYLLKEIPTHGDGDFSDSRFAELYTSELANGLGNLCSRVAKMCEKSGVSGQKIPTTLADEFIKLMDEYELDKSLSLTISWITQADLYLNQHEPWKQSESDRLQTLQEAVTQILKLAVHLQAFLPSTSSKILSHFSQAKITALKPLFPRLEVTP